jgi:hypothetical protein
VRGTGRRGRRARRSPPARAGWRRIACGGGFLVVKGFEYAAKFGAGINLSTNTFYMFYLSLTFFHFMHVILGMVILVALWWKTRQGAYGPGNMNGIESGAAYWHMVDLVWIVLFPLGLCDAMNTRQLNFVWVVLMLATLATYAIGEVGERSASPARWRPRCWPSASSRAAWWCSTSWACAGSNSSGAAC